MILLRNAQACIVGLLLGLSMRVQAEDVSTVRAVRPVSQLTDAEFALVRNVNGRRFWVSKLTRQGSVRPKRAREIASGIAFGRLDKSVLPDGLSELVGATIAAHPATASDAQCQVALEDWGLLAEFDPSPESEQPPPPASKLVARAYAPDSGEELHYAVEITAGTKACEDLAWARLASLPPVSQFPVEELAPRALAHERTRVRRTKTFRDAQRRYAQEGQGMWDEHEFTTVSGFVAQIGYARFTVYSLRHIDDCQSFNEDVSLVFRDAADHTERLQSELVTAFFPTLALDLNADGIPEWLTEYQLIGWNGQAFETVLTVEPASYGCRC